VPPLDAPIQLPPRMATLAVELGLGGIDTVSTSIPRRTQGNLICSTVCSQKVHSLEQKQAA